MEKITLLQLVSIYVLEVLAAMLLVVDAVTAVVPVAVLTNKCLIFKKWETD